MTICLGKLFVRLCLFACLYVYVKTGLKHTLLSACETITLFYLEEDDNDNDEDDSDDDEDCIPTGREDVPNLKFGRHLSVLNSI